MPKNNSKENKFDNSDSYYSDQELESGSTKNENMDEANKPFSLNDYSLLEKGLLIVSSLLVGMYSLKASAMNHQQLLSQTMVVVDNSSSRLSEEGFLKLKKKMFKIDSNSEDQRQLISSLIKNKTLIIKKI